MSLRFALLLLMASLCAGCVLSGDYNPMKTSKGRDEARAAYVQLGLGYLQQGMTERAKVPLKKALEIDGSDPDANAALGLVFQSEMEPELADEHFRKALSSRPADARILNNYGSFLYEEQRYKEAYERFEQAAADTLYPERSRVFENLGMTAAKLGQRDLVLDRARLLLGDLGLQQITDDVWWFVLALDACGHDLVIGAAHPIELEAAHQV